jgi:tRNA-2-methylthio-N6-dimethylallyladenosine synthase
MNERDSEIIAGMLAEKGYEIVPEMDGADIVLFNTCSVRQHAEDRVIGNIQKLRARKKKEPGFKIGVLGCMAQRHGEMLFKEYDSVDIVVGPSNIYDIPELLPESEKREKILAVDRKSRPSRKKVAGDRRKGTFSAFVNIMYGCNNFCSYCIVPYVRGKEVSRPKNDIIDEVKGLVDSGFKEITLLGQNVNSYGKTLTNKISFPELLEQLNEIRGLERLRFISSHPKDAGKSLFRAMADLDKVCEHIHLPLQSGSDKMLDLMNRKYTYDEYRDKIDMLKSMIPGAGITSDFIVGFPSEKEKDCNLTGKAIKEIGFNSSFIFKYSPRPPALSSYLIDDVSDEEKKKRNAVLLEIQKKVSKARNTEMINTVQEILVERKSRMSASEMVGRTRNNTPCVFLGDDSLTGQLVKVKVTGTSVTTLKGEMITG